MRKALTTRQAKCYNIHMIEKRKVKRIFVDMDGVVADFLTGCSEMMGKPLTSDDKGHTEYDLRKEELTNKNNNLIASK